MAQITARNDTTILKIKEFLGLNENPDGDTTLKTGEMAEMRNFRITQDKHLQIRPGTKELLRLSESNGIYGLWYGTVGGRKHVLAAQGGGVYDVDLAAGTARSLGTITAAETSFFGFGGKVYLLNGSEYMSWDGESTTAFESVEGYIPIIMTATTPEGSGTLLEGINRLNGMRRVLFSPDGTAAKYLLPEREISAVTAVTLKGEPLSGYAVDLEDGAVTLTSAPALGTNTLEITYRKGDGKRGDVLGMKFAELFNGATDTRIWLYGDGTNRAIYSGIEYATGKPSAEYFPDLYELSVGESNTPITALVRHYSRMMAFKPDSAWSIQYGSITLDSGATTAAYSVQPVNRQFGNEAPGQVRLLENDPLTLDAGNAYQWRSGGFGYISTSETNAKRVSDRVSESLRGIDFSRVRVTNVKHDHEFWLQESGKALIYNYANDTWYVYTGLPFERALEVENDVYGFGSDGRVFHFSRAYRNDEGEPIDCYAATGAMDFNRDWLLKYSPMIFVAMQPESGARIYVTAETNRRSDYPEKVVAYSLATFFHLDFNHLSFSTNRKPQVKRVKMKIKKATFYRLIYKSNSVSATATVIETDVKLRYAGNVK